MEESFNELVRDLDRLTALKAQRNEIDNEIQFLEEELSKVIDEPVTYSLDGNNYKASIVRGETFTVDAEALLSINPDLYEQVTKKVIDNTAFKRAVSNGDLDAETANSVITIKEKKPYLRIGVIKDSDDE